VAIFPSWDAKLSRGDGFHQAANNERVAPLAPNKISAVNWDGVTVMVAQHKETG
jgi:hypothetical protein